jgi:hypothetical protein
MVVVAMVVVVMVVVAMVVVVKVSTAARAEVAVSSGTGCEDRSGRCKLCHRRC